MTGISTFFSTYFDWLYLPQITWTDVLDIIIIAYLVYHILLWFKTSRAWTLLKGILVLALFLLRRSKIPEVMENLRAAAGEE